MIGGRKRVLSLNGRFTHMDFAFSFPLVTRNVTRILQTRGTVALRCCQWKKYRNEWSNIWKMAFTNSCCNRNLSTNIQNRIFVFWFFLFFSYFFQTKSHFTSWNSVISPNSSRILKFEYRQDNNNSCAFQHFRPLMQVLLVSAINKEIQFAYFSSDNELSNITLKQQVEKKQMEKEFECWDLSNTNVILWPFGLSKFWRKNQKLLLFHWKDLLTQRGVASATDGRKQVGSCSEVWVRKLRFEI